MEMRRRKVQGKVQDKDQEEKGGSRETRSPAATGKGTNGRKEKAEKKKEKAKVFFQRQGAESSRCRLHALNNALGRAAIDVRRFDAAADAFDLRYGLSGSRLYFLLADVIAERKDGKGEQRSREDASGAVGDALHAHSEPLKQNADDSAQSDVDPHPTLVETAGDKGETKEDSDDDESEEEEEDEEDKKEVIDLLSFILREQFKYRTKYIPLNSTVGRLNREELDQCCAFLSFSESHVWAQRRVGNTWYCLDSLQPRPTTIKPKKALASGLGHILIYSKTGGTSPVGEREKRKRRRQKIKAAKQSEAKQQEQTALSIVDQDQEKRGSEDREEDAHISSEKPLLDSETDMEDEADDDDNVQRSNPFDCLGETGS